MIDVSKIMKRMQEETFDSVSRAVRAVIWSGTSAFNDQMGQILIEHAWNQVIITRHTD